MLIVSTEWRNLTSAELKQYDLLEEGKETEMATGLLELPTDPMPAVGVLLDYYRNGAPSEKLGEVGHAAIHLIAFSYGFVHVHAVSLTHGETRLSDTATMSNLETLQRTLTARESVSTAAVDWKMLIKTLLTLLSTLI